MSTAIHLPLLPPVRNLHHSITLSPSHSLSVMSLFSAVLFPFSFFLPGLWKQPVPLICVPTMTKALLRNVQCVYMIECWVNIDVGFIRACFCTIVFADRMKTQAPNRCRRIQNTAYLPSTIFSFCRFHSLLLTNIKNVIYPSAYFFFYFWVLLFGFSIN